MDKKWWNKFHKLFPGKDEIYLKEILELIQELAWEVEGIKDEF